VGKCSVCGARRPLCAGELLPRCRKCAVVFPHHYRITADIFQAMKAHGIPEICKVVKIHTCINANGNYYDWMEHYKRHPKRQKEGIKDESPPENGLLPSQAAGADN
jgi:hypothetical protein